MSFETGCLGELILISLQKNLSSKNDKSCSSKMFQTVLRCSLNSFMVLVFGMSILNNEFRKNEQFDKRCNESEL